MPATPPPPLPKPGEDERTMLRYRTLERILTHLEANEPDQAAALLRRCLDWQTRKAEYGKLMQEWRRLRDGPADDPARAAYLEALDRML